MKQYQITMPDGTVWSVPVDVIARNHAEYYAQYETGGDVERCFKEHSLPLLLGDASEVWEWAAGNMDWDDVAAVAQRVLGVSTPTAAEFQEGWVNGTHAVVPSGMAGPLEGADDESAKPSEANSSKALEGWVNSAVALPSPSNIPKARRGMVEVAELRPGADWEFGYRMAVNLEHWNGLMMFWRYLPDAPGPHA